MPAPIIFDIFVAPHFVLTELAGVVDVLRLTNRVTAQEVFQWHFKSHSGGPIQSSSEAMIASTPLDLRPEADYFFVLGNTDAQSPDLSVGKAIATYTSRQARVVLLSEAASRYIAETDRDASRHTTHWENKAVLRERHGLTETRTSLVVDAGAIITGAGMGATVDLTLSIASQYVSSAAMMTVADILLHEHIRHFQRVLSTTPIGYYRELRLNKANNLLLNTEMKINEIGLACGFPSGFTTIYRETFGMTPNSARK